MFFHLSSDLTILSHFSNNVYDMSNSFDSLAETRNIGQLDKTTRSVEHILCAFQCCIDGSG